MNNLFSFLASFFLFFHPGPPHSPIPTPTPVIFHPYPSSNISVNWGASAPDSTIFMMSNMLPGDTQIRSITVTNTGPASRQLTVKGVKTSELKDFSQILDITVFKDNSPVYGPEPLSRFFTDSTSPSGVVLGSLSGHTSAAYKFNISFPVSAGNDYQLAQIIFNLKIGKVLAVPDKCRKFREDGGQEFDCDTGHKQVFASFDSEDRIDDRDTNRCTAIHP